MGWTRYDAHCYKPNGTVDRKAECGKYFNSCNHYDNPKDGVVKGTYTFSVLKSTMVGSVYYAAVRCVSEETKLDGTSEKSAKVFGVVCLTQGYLRRDGLNFGIKQMDESVGPNESKCPNSILDLLDEPCNTWSREWRTRCREYNEEQKRKRSSRKAA